MPTTFRPYHPKQKLLLRPDLRYWLPEGHITCRVSDLVDGLDLTAFLRSLRRGRPAQCPV